MRSFFNLPVVSATIHSTGQAWFLTLKKKPEGIERNHAYWKEWIAIGKERTLMPGFHEDHGGPLNTQRIEKLAAFLVQKYRTNSH